LKLFQTEVTIAASLYILAETEEEANAKANELTGSIGSTTGLEFSNRRQEIGDGIHMTGEVYSADMPELSLSPSMSIQFSPTQHSCYLTEDFDESDDD